MSKTNKALETGQIKARVLTACAYGVANDVITLADEEAAQAQANGLVDTAPEAVAYAESIALVTEKAE
ncbi:hypothetical protein [Undibacterium sp. Di24W]|uniref:hypothetical protein n=1 Tax=Undibacterium sp. Di24W TaxID=3413033 RepID=UPI003BF2C4DE